MSGALAGARALFIQHRAAVLGTAAAAVGGLALLKRKGSSNAGGMTIQPAAAADTSAYDLGTWEDSIQAQIDGLSGGGNSAPTPTGTPPAPTPAPQPVPSPVPRPVHPPRPPVRAPGQGGGGGSGGSGSGNGSVLSGLRGLGLPVTTTKPTSGYWQELAPGIYLPNAPGAKKKDGFHGYTQQQIEAAAGIIAGG